MTHISLVLCYAEAYKKIKARGAIWVRSWHGGWYSQYSNDAGKLFLSRFDESVQKQIKAFAGEGEPVLHLITKDEVIIA